MLRSSPDDVVCVEIDNTRRNTTSGWLWTRGRDAPVSLWLTGNADPGFSGRRVRLEAVPCEPERDAGILALSDEQIGPSLAMGMTARRRAVLEWASQDGVLCFEFAVASVEVTDGPPLVVWPRRCFEQHAFEQQDLEQQGHEQQGHEQQGHEQQGHDGGETVDRDGGPGVGPGRGDHVPAWSWADGFGDLVDELSVAALFDPPLRLLDPDSVSDSVLDAGFRSLLARLAGEWIAFDVCEHFGTRDAYRLLCRSLVDERVTIPRVRARGSIERFLTHDRCVFCVEEIGGFRPDLARLVED